MQLYSGTAKPQLQLRLPVQQTLLPCSAMACSDCISLRHSMLRLRRIRAHLRLVLSKLAPAQCLLLLLFLRLCKPTMQWLSTSSSLICLRTMSASLSHL